MASSSEGVVPAGVQQFISTLSQEQLAMLDPCGFFFTKSGGIAPLLRQLFNLSSKASDGEAFLMKLLDGPEAPDEDFDINPQAQEKDDVLSYPTELYKGGKDSLWKKHFKHPKVIVPAIKRPAKRPLNSWIAYRSYYAVLFTTIQQKEISGYLTVMWQNDPFKAKWSLLAKAYSIIRDVMGRENVLLPEFLALTTSFVGIITPDRYFCLLGWEFSVVGDGVRALTRRFQPDLKTFGRDILETAVSVQDILQFCYDHGYVSGDLGKMQVKSSAKAIQQNLMTTSAAAHRSQALHGKFQQAHGQSSFSCEALGGDLTKGASVTPFLASVSSPTAKNIITAQNLTVASVQLSQTETPVPSCSTLPANSSTAAEEHVASSSSNQIQQSGQLELSMSQNINGMSTEQRTNLDARGPPENLTAIGGGLASSVEGDDMDVDRIVGGESTASATNGSVDIQRRGVMPSSVRNVTLGRPSYTPMEDIMPLSYHRPAIPVEDPPMDSLEAILEFSGDQWPYDNQFSSNPMVDLIFDPYGDADGNPIDISEFIDFSRFTED